MSLYSYGLYSYGPYSYGLIGRARGVLKVVEGIFYSGGIFDIGQTVTGSPEMIAFGLRPGPAVDC